MIKRIITAVVALLAGVPALAQTVDPHAGHTMPGAAAGVPVDHSKMIMTMPPAAADNPMPGMDHGTMNHGGMTMTPAPKGITRKNIGPAEAALQAFLDALEVGNRDLAIARLAPDLTVVEDGAEERYAEYVGGHLAADIAYQKSVKTILLERSIYNDGPSRARIVSRIRMVGNRSDKPIDTLIDEKAVLAKLPNGWKILRIEWISAK